MEEAAENKEIDSESPHLGKKYIYGLRNKWITSRAVTIDDFIKTYEQLADKMKRWKEDGIDLDPDGCAGDDYAQFCTYDERVAIKEGFEEEIVEEYEDDLEREESDNEFQINEYLTLKLID